MRIALKIDRMFLRIRFWYWCIMFFLMGFILCYAYLSLAVVEQVSAKDEVLAYYFWRYEAHAVDIFMNRTYSDVPPGGYKSYDCASDKKYENGDLVNITITSWKLLLKNGNYTTCRINNKVGHMVPIPIYVDISPIGII